MTLLIKSATIIFRLKINFVVVATIIINIAATAITDIVVNKFNFIMTSMCLIFTATDTRCTTSKFKKILKTKNKHSTESLNENCIHRKLNSYEIIKNWNSLFHDHDRATFRNAHINFDKKNIYHFFLFSLIIFFHCKKFFFFIEVLLATFSQFLSNFFSFMHCNEKITERRERFKHEYVFLKFDIENVSDNLQLIINEKFNWFSYFNNSLNKLTRFSFIHDIFHHIFLVHDYLHQFCKRFSELFNQNLKSFL